MAINTFVFIFLYLPYRLCVRCIVYLKLNPYNKLKYEYYSPVTVYVLRVYIHIPSHVQFPRNIASDTKYNFIRLYF
jgi:hypothetical protein